MVKKQTSARAEGGKTIFQFNLVQLGIWIIETLEWVWGTDSIEDKDHWRRAVQYGGGTMSLLTQRESIESFASSLGHRAND
eukprot:scaffold2836_cov95-Skeletonema_marinoi.AAC.1